MQCTTMQKITVPCEYMKTLPADVLAENGHVVGDDEGSEYTRCAPVRCSSDGAVQTSDLFNEHNRSTFPSRCAMGKYCEQGCPNR